MPTAVLLAHLPGKHDQSTHAHGGAGVRSSLAQAKTVDEVNASAGAEAKRITGRTTTFDMAGSDVEVAKEHAEGVLLGMERYPNVRVGQVVTYGPGGARPDVFAQHPKIDSVYAATHIAPTQPGGVIFVETIGFNARYAGDSPRYRAGLDHDVTAGYAVKGGPKSTGAHEYGHLAANQTASANPAMRVVSDRARTAGVAPSMLIREQVSGYAATSKHELMAEAFADVVLHGSGASDASHAVVAEMDAGYARSFPTTAALVAAAAGQPYVSPDDLNSIIPLWQTAVAEHVTPVVAEVFRDTADQLHAQLVNVTDLPQLPSVSSLAAETYLAQAVNTFEQVGDDLWETARTQLLEGFQKGESIPELATRLRASAGLSAKTAVLVARTQVLDASNSASIATARVSGIPMRKGWLDTPDARTRESHLLAGSTYGTDEQMIDLEAQFIVGGYSCDRPHDPVLPPSERYNCFPAGTSVVAPNLELAYRRPYHGEMVTLLLASGDELTATPNHPILTDVGWRPLGEVDEGCHLIRCTFDQVMGLVDPHVDHMPTDIDQIFSTFDQLGYRRRVTGCDVDFHGDGSNSEIDIVGAHGQLLDAGVSEGGQPISHLGLPSADVLQSLLSSPGAADGFAGVGGPLSSRRVRSLDERTACSAVDLRHALVHGSASPATIDAGFRQPQPYHGAANVETEGQRLFGFAGEVTVDKVIYVKRDASFHGHVYNLQTQQGWYIANGFIVRNCRCSLAYSVSDDDVAEARDLWTPEPPIPNTTPIPSSQLPGDTPTVAEARNVADLIAEAEELIGNEVDSPVLAARLRALAARQNIPAHVSQGLVDAAGDVAGLRKALRKVAKDADIIPIGQAGHIVLFDAAIHRSAETVRAGDAVEIFRPGAWYDGRGGRVLLFKALVETPGRAPRGAFGTHTSGQAGIASTTLVAHLPGKHDQSSHGRLGGKEFDDRAVRAKTGSEALESVAYQPSSEAIANALSVYGGRSPGPRSMNRPLREGQELNPETRANIKAMDHAMREGPGIREETLVYRAIPDGGPFGISRDQVQNADLTGLTWQDPAFVSTGVDDWDGRGTMMRILVPAGTPALSNTDRLDNDEIVLDRGLTFRVVADRGPRAGTRTIKVLDVEVSREN